MGSLPPTISVVAIVRSVALAISLAIVGRFAILGSPPFGEDLQSPFILHLLRDLQSSGDIILLAYLGSLAVVWRVALAL